MLHKYEEINLLRKKRKILKDASEEKILKVND